MWDDADTSRDNTGFTDSLLDCLVILTQLNQRPFSAEALRSGLPLINNRLTPSTFIKASQRAGLSARIVQRKLRKISKLVLPAVLILKNNHACVLNKILDDGNVEIIFPESGEGTSRLTMNDLEADYSGFAIFIKPIYQFDKRADEHKLTQKKSWFWDTIWDYRSAYSQIIIAAFLVNLFALVTPLFIMNVYDRVVPNNAMETLWVLSSGVIIVILFDFMLRSLRGYLIDVTGKKSDTLLTSELFQKVTGIQMASRPISSGAFASNLRDFEVLRDFFTSASLTAIIDIPFIFLFLWIISIVAGSLVWIPFAAVPLVFASAYLLSNPMQRAAEKGIMGATQKHAILVETVNNLETIKTLSAEGLMQQKWEQFTSISATANLKSRFFSTLAVNITVFIQQLVTVIIIIAGVYMISKGDLSVGGLIATTILSGRALAPLAQVAGTLMRFEQSKLALGSLNKIMALPVERPADKNFLNRPVLRGALKFNNVTFHYGNQKNLALQHASFTIKPGEHVALLGRTGSGKSTVQKLLINLFQVTDGTIFIDDTDIAQIDPANLRHNIAYVQQEFPLFFGTVRSNIAMAAPWSTDAAILKAAKLAGVDRFVSHHSSGYDMPIGERGDGLSDGQKQSIAVARALLIDTPILLLDEPTSALDPNTEQELVSNLKAYTKQKTLLLATHKLSMLALVDRLIILDNGKIVADGPKESVLAQLQQNTKQSGNDSKTGGNK